MNAYFLLSLVSVLLLKRRGEMQRGSVESPTTSQHQSCPLGAQSTMDYNEISETCNRMGSLL